MLKRWLDVAASFLGLLILSPIFLILWLLVKLDSRGPALYRQQRVGRGNKNFTLLKFRTMHVDADKKGTLITVGGRDPRITRLGYYLRKFKLDELPQLINVLRGDMSLVGPRPEVRKYVNCYTPEQMEVLSIRPGITDPASIKFSNENELLDGITDPEKHYIEVIMPQKLALNLEYIRTRSFWRDIGIILSTIGMIFRKR
jgi:lipopolysaccharide/colanic/teichoic acid biosynthesis glycosyltransferase